MSQDKITATVVVFNRTNGARTAIQAEYHFMDGCWQPYFKPSAAQLWAWCKCTGTGKHNEAGSEVVGLEIENVIPDQQGFSWYTRFQRGRPSNVCLIQRDKATLYDRWSSGGFMEGPRDAERDRWGYLPEDPEYGDCDKEDQVA